MNKISWPFQGGPLFNQLQQSQKPVSSLKDLMASKNWREIAVYILLANNHRLILGSSTAEDEILALPESKIRTVTALYFLDENCFEEAFNALPPGVIPAEFAEIIRGILPSEWLLKFSPFLNFAVDVGDLPLKLEIEPRVYEKCHGILQSIHPLAKPDSILTNLIPGLYFKTILAANEIHDTEMADFDENSSIPENDSKTVLDSSAKSGFSKDLFIRPFSDALNNYNSISGSNTEFESNNHSTSENYSITAIPNFIPGTIASNPNSLVENSMSFMGRSLSNDLFKPLSSFSPAKTGISTPIKGSNMMLDVGQSPSPAEPRSRLPVKSSPALILKPQVASTSKSPFNQTKASLTSSLEKSSPDVAEEHSRIPKAVKNSVPSFEKRQLRNTPARQKQSLETPTRTRRKEPKLRVEDLEFKTGVETRSARKKGKK